MAHPQSTKGRHVCEWCGETFTDLKHQGRRFCSHRCASFARPRTSRPLAERLWEKVDRTGDGCWPWQAARLWSGYGVLNLGTGKGNVLAHRLAYELTFGPFDPGLHVCHHCDNPACCNPAHLFLGTDGDNMRDASRKGRMVIPHPQGTAHTLAKLNDDAVREIRRRVADGETQRAVASRFDIPQAAVWRIIHRKSWAHVP
jgi:hypothetical protein